MSSWQATGAKKIPSLKKQPTKQEGQAAPAIAMIRIVVIAMAGLLYRYSGRPVANLTGTKMEVLRWKNSSCRISSETTRCRYNIGAVHKIKNSAKNMLKRACKSEKQVLLYFSRLERGKNEKEALKNKTKKLLTKALEFDILSELRPTRERGRGEHW